MFAHCQFTRDVRNPRNSKPFGPCGSAVESTGSLWISTGESTSLKPMLFGGFWGGVMFVPCSHIVNSCETSETQGIQSLSGPVDPLWNPQGGRLWICSSKSTGLKPMLFEGFWDGVMSVPCSHLGNSRDTSETQGIQSLLGPVDLLWNPQGACGFAQANPQA